MENGMMLQGFSWYLPADGAHWKRLAELAPTLAHMGVSSVWMPPAYKSSEGAEGVGYAVYDPWDLGEFDQCGSVRTKYGTRREYLSAIRALQKAGIQVLADVVLNQRFGGEECEDVLATPINPANRNEQAGEPRQISAWTRYRFPGRGDEYSDFHWDWHCFHGTDWDESTHEPGVYLFNGKHWDEDVDKSENGNYDYLMGSDVDVSEPAVEEELGRWGEWYLKTTGVDGFRLDALKHISRAFFHRWLTRLREATGKELFTVGEYWSPEVEDLESYLGEVPMSLFDVPLHYRLFDASNSMGERDLAHVFDDTLVQREPIRAVTFVDNHDTQPNQALQSTVQDWFKPSAYMLILLREAGYPCVFFGDLFGIPNDGNIPVVAELPLLMELRQRFAFGPQNDYLDDANLIGWTREGDDAHPMSGVAVVLTDAEGGSKRMRVGARHAGSTFCCVVGSEEKDVAIDDEGYGEFSCGGGCGCAYVRSEVVRSLEHDRVLRSIQRIVQKVQEPRYEYCPVSVNAAPHRTRARKGK